MEFFVFANRGRTALMFYNDDVNTILFYSVIIGLVSFAVMYGFKAATLYTIAKNNDYKNGWMAFVPFLNTYYIGVVSQKNKIFGAKPVYFSLALAMTQHDLLTIQTTSQIIYGETVTLPIGLEPLTTIPDALFWAYWVAKNLRSAVITWVEFIYILLQVSVVLCFFKTYSPKYYFILAIVSVVLPIQAIMMFTVRRGKATNYLDYIRATQAARYRYYQQYSSGKTYSYNYDPYTGKPLDPEGDPYNQPEDPFNGYGKTYGEPEDPFDGLGKN